MDKDICIAIVLAAGQGSRMQSKVAKQYMTVNEKPLLYYSLLAFQESEVDQIILVVGNGEEEYCRENIVDCYGFSKVSHVVCGGSERYLSVYNALQFIDQIKAKWDSNGIKCKDTYVLIHDAARPLVTQDIIHNTIEGVKEKKAVIVAVPTKDTIKILNEEGYVETTPKRSQTYVVQTPQAFEYHLLHEAYSRIVGRTDVEITDDAMVVEYAMQQPIGIVNGDYTNLKVTTPEDITIIENLMNK